MSDIVERLGRVDGLDDETLETATNAAAEIERLRARVAELKAERNEARSVLKKWEYAALKNYPKGRAWTGTPAQILSVFVDVATSAEKSHNRWKAIAEKRHAILLDLEWIIDAKDGDGSYCPYCMSMDDEVHVAGCKMAEAIAKSARAANGEVGQ